LLFSSLNGTLIGELGNLFPIGNAVRRALESHSATAVIVGGSLAGLAAGIELRAAGLQVSIHERSERVLDDRGAGIVMQPDTQQILIERCGLREEKTGVWLRYRQYLGKDGKPEVYQPMPQLMTSWGLLYRAMRGAFPEEAYFEGDTLISFEDGKSQVRGSFAKSGEVDGDLLVAADGSRSLIRSVLFPEVKPRYAGYLAWRGVVAENEASADLLKSFANHFTFQQMHRSHILCYLIPGANGETEPGARRLNWVWYWNVPEAGLPAVMTGRDGKIRDFSVPPGQIRQELIKEQNRIAEELFCPQFLALWRATREPFAQPILDLAVPRMRQGRIAIVGDAAFIPRPHTAGSTSKAAANARELGRALVRHRLNIDQALQEWEPPQLDLGLRMEIQGKTLGDRSQFPP
jgi:2-polyprenyl-6-methoxyphenol hydroxylase-like FAD-dependent oxidoreductase